MSDDDPYVYPGTRVLRNLLDIEEPEALDFIERNLVQVRIEEGVPIGRFDLAHLKAIHRHLFQDVYEWAGEIRTVEISKGGSQFQFRRFIHTGMADVHRRLESANYLRDLSPGDFAVQAGQIIGDVNYVHPFREGNGRSQLQYLKQLAVQAGHKIDLAKLDPTRWLDASKKAHQGRYELMAKEIFEALT